MLCFYMLASRSFYHIIEAMKNETAGIAEREVMMETVINDEEEKDTQLQDIVTNIIADANEQQVTEDIVNGAQTVTENMDNRAQVVTETMNDGAQEITEQEQLAVEEVLDAEKSLQIFAALLLEQLSQ